jgi:ACS family D-galactonate transporter-like MFS transporter
MVVGFAVGGTGSFGGALSFIAALALLGVASYLFVLGSVHRLVIAD